MSHNLFSSLFVNSFSMFRVSSEAKFLEVELPGSLALSISEVLKALPAAPMGCLHSCQCGGCLSCCTYSLLWWLNDWRYIESLAGDTGKGEMDSLDMSEPSVGLILYTHTSQAVDSGFGVSTEQGSHWRVASVQGRACLGQSFRVKLCTLKTLEHCFPDDLPYSIDKAILSYVIK